MSKHGSLIFDDRFVENLEIKLIRPPTNPLRRELGDIEGLAHSIKNQGLLQPVIVRQTGSGFELVAGHRRLEACKLLRWKRISCDIRNLSDREADEVAIAENVQRKTLDSMEEARAFDRYVRDYGWGGVRNLAVRIGKSESYVRQRIKLLELPKEVQDMVSSGTLYASSAREIAWAKDEVKTELIERVSNRAYPSRFVKTLAQSLCKPSDHDLDDFSMTKPPSRRDERIINEVITNTRILLMRMDLIIDGLSDNDLLKNFLMELRFRIHEQVDMLIRLKKKLADTDQRSRIEGAGIRR